MSVGAAIKTNHGKVEPVIRTKNLAVAFCRGSYGKACRSYGKGVEKFTSRNHKFSYSKIRVVGIRS
jgi:hypothetical protein